MSKYNEKSPYLATESRLADVIAAIQAAGTYKFYKLDFETWADRICGDAAQAEHWRRVFFEHPEFFRLDSGRTKASLVLRRQRQKLFNVDDEKVWQKADIDALPAPQRLRFSRLPLTASEIEALVDVAISLHTRATERERDRHRWIAPVLGFLGAITGGVLVKVVELAFRTSP